MYDVPAFIIKWIIIVLVMVALEMAQPNISLMWTPGERFFKSIIIAPSILWQLMDLITRFESHAQVYNIMVTGEAMKSKSLRCGNWFPFLYSVCFSGYRTTVSFHSNHTEKKKGEKKKAIFLFHFCTVILFQFSPFVLLSFFLSLFRRSSHPWQRPTLKAVKGVVNQEKLYEGNHWPSKIFKRT